MPPIDTTTLPAWHVDTPTDTDGDGLPDFWEIGTYSNPLVPGNDIDRDGDGLTDLQEFHYQTNPRRVDTDADGFWDGYELLHDMDPLAKNDAGNPNEPDADNNGIPDIWQSPYGGILSNHYLFTDSNNDGWHDGNYAYELPPASADNFDVEVAIWTLRSAALDWSVGVALVVMPTTSASVKLRLPIGQTRNIQLSASPSGVELPAGELWKAKVDISFLPRSGQTASGNALMVGNGRVMLKDVVASTVIKCFDGPPDAPQHAQQSASQNSAQQGGVAAFASTATNNTGGGDDTPKIIIHSSCFKIGTDSAMYHEVGEQVGQFRVATNTTGVASSKTKWKTNCGAMNPPSGAASWLTTGEPPYDYKIVVIAGLDIDSETTVQDYITVSRCTPPCGDCGCAVCPGFSITPAAQAHPITATSAEINAISNGCAGASGGIVWTVEPPGLAITSANDSKLVFSPTNSMEGKFTVTATSATHSNISDTAEVYVVEIITQTHAKIPSDRERKTIGVGETVYMDLAPPKFGASWSASDGTMEEGSPPMPFPNGMEFYAPSYPCTATVTATLAAGPSVEIEFEVIKPDGYIATPSVDLTSTDKAENLNWVEGNCGADMFFDIKLTPTNVSFYSVLVKELPGVSTNATGYFNRSFLSTNILVHMPNHSWTQVREDNSLGDKFGEFNDHAGGFGWSQPWPGGTYSWPVPAVWHMLEKSEANELPWSDQYFEIYENGDFTVSKFGWSITRGTNNLYTITTHTP